MTVAKEMIVENVMRLVVKIVVGEGVRVMVMVGPGG